MSQIDLVPWMLPLGDGWKVVFTGKDGKRIRLWQTYDERLAQGVCQFLLDLQHLPQTDGVLEYLTQVANCPPTESPDDSYVMGMEDQD